MSEELERSLIDNFVNGSPLDLLEDAYGKSANDMHNLIREEIKRLNNKVLMIDQVANSSHECECEKAGMLTIIELTEVS